MKIKSKYFVNLFTIIFGIFLIFNIAQANGDSGFLGFDTSSPCAYWKSVFDFGMMAASILAVAMLVYGGIYYMVSLGQEDRISSAKSVMTGAVVGFLLAISSWLIFKVLSPTLLECKLEVPQIDLGEVGDSTTSSSDPCAGLNESDLFDSQEECMEGWDGTCSQQLPQTTSTTSSGSGTSCTSNDQCESGQTCEGANADTGESGTCTGGEDDEDENDDEQRRWCRVPPASGLYEEMMNVCSSDGNLTSYSRVIERWRNILPGQAVYVGGGHMSGGTCHASEGTQYLRDKLQSSAGYRSDWVDPVGGDLDQAVSNYRAWAQGLGGRYCGDCLTFSRELYSCAGSSVNVVGIATSSSATYRFDNPSEFATALQNGSAEMTAGSFIYFGDDCGHAINYTGVSGAEVIEMGGGGSSITVNGHRASTVNITSTLQSYVSSGWVHSRDCHVYVHRPLE